MTRLLALLLLGTSLTSFAVQAADPKAEKTDKKIAAPVADEATLVKTLLDTSAKGTARMDAAFSLRKATTLSDSAFDALLKVASEEEASSGNFVRTNALDALREHATHAKAKTAIPTLLTIAAHKDKFLRWKALSTLLKIDPKASEVHAAFLKALDDQDTAVRKMAVRGIAADDSNIAALVPLFEKTLKDKEGEVRAEAAEQIEALSEAGHTDKLVSLQPLLVQTLKDSYPMAKGFAASAIRNFVRHGKPVPESIPSLVENLSHEHTFVRKSAIYALTAMKADAAPAIPKLTALLQDDNPTVRHIAGLALNKIGTPEAKEALQKATPGKAPKETATKPEEEEIAPAAGE